jgi:ketosteroid isomerase-like protein
MGNETTVNEGTLSETTLKDELLALERRFWKAIQEKDVATATSLTEFPCIVAGAQGVGRVGQPAFEKMMREAAYTLEEFELQPDAECRLLGGDVAVLAYDVRERLTVDGRPVELRASDTSVWVRRDGRWRCALHTESLTGDPYGRDKAKDPAGEDRSSPAA